MIPFERYRELLALIEAERERRLADGAVRRDAECRRAISEARAEVRRRARRTFAELRRRAEGEERASRAALDGARRARRFVADRVLAEQALTQLADALRRRWGDAAARRAWIDTTLAAATRLLPAGKWRLACAPGAGAGEIEALHAHGGAHEEASLEAGLRIEAAAACVDASLAGLLRDRRALQSALLAEVAAQVAT